MSNKLEITVSFLVMIITVPVSSNGGRPALPLICKFKSFVFVSGIANVQPVCVQPYKSHFISFFFSFPHFSFFLSSSISKPKILKIVTIIRDSNFLTQSHFPLLFQQFHLLTLRFDFLDITNIKEKKKRFLMIY